MLSEIVGRTNRFLVRSWTDAPEFVSQTLRPESGIIVLRLLPTTNPYSILPPLMKSVPDGPISSHEYLSLMPPSSDAPSYFVYLVESHAPVLLVLVTHNGSIIDRVIFRTSKSLLRRIGAEIDLLNATRLLQRGLRRKQHINSKLNSPFSFDALPTRLINYRVGGLAYFDLCQVGRRDGVASKLIRKTFVSLLWAVYTLII